MTTEEEDLWPEDATDPTQASLEAMLVELTCTQHPKGPPVPKGTRFKAGETERLAFDFSKMTAEEVIAYIKGSDG